MPGDFRGGHYAGANHNLEHRDFLLRQPGIGLNRDAVIDFVKKNKPTYPQFAGWVKKSATKLDRGSVEKLNAAAVNVLKANDTKARFAAFGLDAQGSTPEEFASFIKSDLAKWTRIVKESNIVVE